MADYNAHIGELKIGRNEDTLTALLGSCVGIYMCWPERNVHGLVHCLLPKAPKKTFEICARYVDQAVDSLVVMMKIKADDKKSVFAVVVGGANMTKPNETNPEQLIGAQNVKNALSCLRDKKIKVIEKSVGGFEGKQIRIECSSGDYTIKTIPRS